MKSFSSLPTYSSKTINTILLAVILIPIAVHGWLIIRYSINLPFGDDIDQQFARYRNLDSGIWSLWQFLFVQHNEHRLLTTHLLTLGSLTIGDEINIRYQLWFVVLVLIALLISVAMTTQKSQRLWLLAIAAPLLMLPNTASVWLGGGVQYYAVLLFGVLCLMSLNRISRTKYFLISLLCFFLALYSMASGIVVLIPAIGMLMFCVEAEKKVKLLWLAFAGLLTAFFFIGYQISSEKPSIFVGLQQPLYTLQYALLLLGNAFFGQHIGRAIQVVAMLALAIMFVRLLQTATLTKLLQNTAFYTSLYTLGVLALVVLGRVGHQEWESALSPRYLVYTKVFWLCLLALLFSLKKFSIRARWLLLVCACGYFAKGLGPAIGQLQAAQVSRSVDMSEMIFSANPSGLRHAGDPDNAANIVKTAMTMGIFHPQFVTNSAVELTQDSVDGAPERLRIDDRQFNEYRRLTVYSNLLKPPIIQIAPLKNTQRKLSYRARALPKFGKYELLFKPTDPELNGPLSIRVLREEASGKLSVVWQGQTESARLYGSRKKYQ